VSDQISENTREVLISMQKNEITEYYIYSKIADRVGGENGQILRDIAEDEKQHYQFWKRYTHQEMKPSKMKVWFYYILSIILGLTFALKLFEDNEEEAQEIYSQIENEIPESREVIADEDQHEDELLALISEERLDYIGSVVLGLNDALVELTGTLAGLTFAMRDADLIALAGMITGVAASLSMTASQYLSTKSGAENKSALKSASYTGLTYIITVVFLILPFLLLANYFLSLAITLMVALLIVLIFNYYISVAQDLNFRSRFFEMALISFGVAFLTFFIGYIIRISFGIDI